MGSIPSPRSSPGWPMPESSSSEQCGACPHCLDPRARIEAWEVLVDLAEHTAEQICLATYQQLGAEPRQCGPQRRRGLVGQGLHTLFKRLGPGSLTLALRANQDFYRFDDASLVSLRVE